MNEAKPKTRLSAKLRKIKQYAKTLRTQEDLNRILLPIDDPFKRRACFNMLEPFLQFEGHCPFATILQRDMDKPIIQSL